MPSTLPPVGERLSFDWAPEVNGVRRLTIVEHRARKDRETAYLVERSGAGVWLFAKAEDYEGERDSEIYETRVMGLVTSCTCTGSQTRHHALKCRHVLSLEFAIQQGVISCNT